MRAPSLAVVRGLVFVLPRGISRRARDCKNGTGHPSYSRSHRTSQTLHARSVPQSAAFVQNRCTTQSTYRRLPTEQVSALARALRTAISVDICKGAYSVAIRGRRASPPAAPLTVAPR